MRIGKMEWLLGAYDAKTWNSRILKIFKNLSEVQGLYLVFTQISQTNKCLKQLKEFENEIAIFAAGIYTGDYLSLIKVNENYVCEHNILIVFDKNEINEDIDHVIIPKTNYTFV